MEETKFEQDLRKYFPDVYKIHEAGKFDKHIWLVFEGMMQMLECSGYGEITVTYQHGRINRVVKSLVTTSESSKRGVHTNPSI